MKILVTGSNGLIGFNVSRFFLDKGFKVLGIDNNMRQQLFGPEASNLMNRKKLLKNKLYTHYSYDIRNIKQLENIFKNNNFDLIVHCAGQPSHDKAKDIPILDFEINATGTLNLLELTRKYQKDAVFVYTSTNKVYGDNPNKLKIQEKKTRYECKKMINGINENMSIDQNTHSLMGSSKLAADIYVQEYGKYFGLKTTALRLGCVTGYSHAGVKLHGFVSYLIKSIMHSNTYEIIGYKGKQVRDQIDAYDVASAIFEIYKKPNIGEVFNMGGGAGNGASILEMIKIISNKLQVKPKITYAKNPRIGDHMFYVTDYAKFQKWYPNWRITKDLNQIIDEIIDYEKASLTSIDILGTKISVTSYPDLLKIIENRIGKKSGFICVSAVHLLMESLKNKMLQKNINKSLATTTDGMPLVWIARSILKQKVQRVYGPDLTLKTCKLSEKRGYKVFFLGGAIGQSTDLKINLLKLFPKLKIVGVVETPVRPIPKKQNDEILMNIKSSKADIIFVGLGCPLQEQWMIKNYENFNTGVFIGVGAAFDFISHRIKQAPVWMRGKGLEWLFRLSQDPKRLWRRYLILNTKFIWNVLKNHSKIYEKKITLP